MIARTTCTILSHTFSPFLSLSLSLFLHTDALPTLFFFHLHGSHGCFSFPSDDQSSHFFRSFAVRPREYSVGPKYTRGALDVKRSSRIEGMRVPFAGNELGSSLSRGIINRPNQHYALSSLEISFREEKRDDSFGEETGELSKFLVPNCRSSRVYQRVTMKSKYRRNLLSLIVTTRGCTWSSLT